MSELIDRQALKNKLKRWDECDPYEFVEIAFHAVDDAPTIDAVPVVRCKDCDNWSIEFSSGRKSLGNYRCICQEWSDAEDHCYVYTGENEYCSRGERREG